MKRCKLFPTLPCGIYQAAEGDVDEMSVALAGARRSLIFPYLRVWNLAALVVRDVRDILAAGKRCILRCLLQVKKIMFSRKRISINLNLNDIGSEASQGKAKVDAAVERNGGRQRCYVIGDRALSTRALENAAYSLFLP